MLAVIDTDVINYLLKKEPVWADYEILLDRERISLLTDWVICFATVQELYVWALKDRNIETAVSELFKKCRLAPVPVSVCLTAAKIRRYLQRNETTKERGWHDVWVAATAIDNNLPVVTNNDGHFKRFEKSFGLRVLTV